MKTEQVDFAAVQRRVEDLTAARAIGNPTDELNDYTDADVDLLGRAFAKATGDDWDDPGVYPNSDRAKWYKDYRAGARLMLDALTAAGWRPAREGMPARPTCGDLSPELINGGQRSRCILPPHESEVFHEGPQEGCDWPLKWRWSPGAKEVSTDG